MEFDTINDALKHFGRGNLIGKNLYNAHGITDNGNHVWLPKFYKNPDHINVNDVINNRECILQIDLNPTGGTPDTVPQHVFTRERGLNSKYEINDIGLYQQVLYDSNRFFSIHVKLPFNSAKTMQKEPDGLCWDKGFFSSAKEARKKADELYKTAMEKSKAQQ